MFKKVILFTILCIPFFGSAQVDIHEASTEYEYPTDPLVRKKLDQWQDLKFGVILHWGLYSVKGMNESWPLVNELWKRRDTTITYEEYKKWYWDQSKTFNPVKFNPEKWAEISKNAGMKYLVFTTKHHEGFSMFDTKENDFKITNGPFANNPKADVTKHIFDAYRKQGMMIGAYFSKPDWHSEYFWWPRFAAVNRNVNYNTNEFPKQWQKFKDFTYNQIGEILGNYGKVDILWLDGGWIRDPQPGEMEKAYVPSNKPYYPPYPQNVDMPRIAKMAREKQPGILVVDRTVHGAYENYRTPELSIPKTQLKDPWETCLTLAKGWGHTKKIPIKSGTWIIHTLAEVVAKGGNLLLGWGPTAEGEFPEYVDKPLQEIGTWLKVNGEAIYGTRITENYNDGSTWFTQSKDGKKKYAIFCIQEGATIPQTITWKGNIPAKGKKIKLMATGKNLNWKQKSDAVVIEIPNELVGNQTAALAFAF